MFKKIPFLFFILVLGSSSAQNFSKQFNLPPSLNVFNSDTLKILAVMVDFQEDKYDATIGTGKFGSHFTKDYKDTIIDPLPHNADYFSDHLLFAKNYFKKVSSGKLNISYKVLPQVLTVSKMMREYSPAYGSNDLTPLGKFSEEVWKLADEKFAGVKFSDYNLFIIFHAGVSSGLNLGTFSIDRNLPSLYLSVDAFKKIYGAQFSGFQFKNGIVNNTLIMPETESREQTLIDNSVSMVEVSINGSLVSNIASYLGLPDLFNTETGLSAIGRFGLMDGQAIGASYGMFPPEPSPWEKMYLGWESPKVISKDENNISVVTRPTAKLTDTTLVKIPISSGEYFLIENRSQDANKDKVKITYKRSGQIYTKIVESDTSGYYFIAPDSIPGGVIIDVDEFDASIPGNGIVIWHIDENIIKTKIAENKINSDLNHRGVYVVEADGIQDIGQVYNSVFGQIIADGDIYDFWYKGNKARFYKNRFTPDSKPNTNSNSGANSLITIDNISSLSNRISFDVSFENGNIKLISSIDISNNFMGLPVSIRILPGKNGMNYFVHSQDVLLKYSPDGKILNRIDGFGNRREIASVYDQNKQYVISSSGKFLSIYLNDESIEKENGRHIKVNLIHDISRPVVIIKKSGELYLNACTWDGYLLEEKLSSIISNGKISESSFKYYGFSGAEYLSRPFQNETDYFLVGDLFIDSNGKTSKVKTGSEKSVLVKNGNGDIYIIALATMLPNYQFFITKNGKLLNSFPIQQEKVPTEFIFSVADLFNDGRIFILYNNGPSLTVYDLNGIILKNFPITESGVDQLSGAPFAIDIDRDGITEIIVVSERGDLFAYNSKTGKMKDGFPLSIGGDQLSYPFIYSEELPSMGPIPSYRPYLAVLDFNEHLTVWSLSTVQGKAYWTSEYGNATNNSFVEITGTSTTTSEFFPSDKAYNWPNPVYGSSTNIRYYVSENSTVNVKIFDLSGWKVDELNTNATGGFDNEVKWDVSKIASGIYYANLDVKGESGKSASKIIKIAVIK